MGVTQVSRDWIVFSSSSGETLQALWRALSVDAQKSCRGLFSDRECGALEIAKKINLPCNQFTKQEFEAKVLKEISSFHSDCLILLCGFFGILSDDFLAKCPLPIVNTHPSLLPAHPGLDKKVHQQAHKEVCISGFSIHLVTPVLDGGTILFQHPVWMDAFKTWEDNRESVRKAEQKILPLVWEKILQSELRKEDTQLNSQVLRNRLNLNLTYFEDKKEAKQ